MNIVLGITGSVAATVTPKLYARLIEEGHNVKIVASVPAMYFTSRDFLEELWQKNEFIYQDKVEWPEGGYHKNDPVKHIEFRDWADLLLIAPLTANTLAKMANGMADNFLSCIVRAWPKQKPLVIAPAMNTEMWIDPITEQQLHLLSDRFNLTIHSPVEKMLACGEVGIGAMVEIDNIVRSMRWLSQQDC